MQKMNKKKQKGSLFMKIGLLLLAAALFLTVYNYWEAFQAKKAAQAVAEQLRAEPEEIEQLYMNGMPVTEVDGNYYIGMLDIPCLELSLPVMADWDYEKMKISPCRYTGSYYTDDVVIMAHNYASHFYGLKKLAIGEGIYFTNAEGVVCPYMVANVEVLEAQQIEEMVSGDWDLTLFTCTTDGQSRYAVRCYRK